MQAESQAPGICRQIDRRTSLVPRYVFAPESAATERRMRLPERNHVFEETKKDILVRLELAHAPREGCLRLGF